MIRGTSTIFALWSTPMKCFWKEKIDSDANHSNIDTLTTNWMSNLESQLSSHHMIRVGKERMEILAFRQRKRYGCELCVGRFVMLCSVY